MKDREKIKARRRTYNASAAGRAVAARQRAKLKTKVEGGGCSTPGCSEPAQDRQKKCAECLKKCWAPCCKQPPQIGKKACSYHLQRAVQYQQKTYARRAASGLCTWGGCTDYSQPGTKSCEIHLAAVLASSIKARAKQVAEGRCVYCGEPKNGRKARLCASCASMVKERVALRVAECVRLGLCSHQSKCERKAEPGILMCSEHRKKYGKKHGPWRLRKISRLHQSAPRLEAVEAIALGNTDCLTDRERYVLTQTTGKTLREVGESLGVSRERVRQIQEIALGKLRASARAQVAEQSERTR